MRRMGIEGLLWLLLGVGALGTLAFWFWRYPHHRTSQARVSRPPVATKESEEEIPSISREQLLKNALLNAKTPEEKGRYYLVLLRQSSERQKRIIFVLGMQAEEEKPPLPPSVMAKIYLEWARENRQLFYRDRSPDQLEELAMLYAKCLNAALSEITMEEERTSVPGVSGYVAIDNGDGSVIRGLERKRQREMATQEKAEAQNDLVDARNNSLDDLRTIFHPRPEARAILEQKLDLYLKQPQYRQTILDRVYGKAK